MKLIGKSLLAVAYVTVLAGGEDPPLAELFRFEAARITAKPLIGIDSPSVWKDRRHQLQTKLKDMLGLIPEPPRGDLHVEVRGTVERPDFVIEKIAYQSLPGLYVTANIYRPKGIERRLPAILYVCGHSKVEKDGVIYGNKAHYQHHAAWFAANGYVCLIVDTLELGELPGEHHGTYNKGRWWWQSRGYTPAGVEAWNAVRGIDYLVSRPDVDATKIGVTGRSGGGATSWWVGAIDDRVAAVCPVAGITDLKNHVVDGVVEGHCDCMYFVNTARWDYDMLAALVAPKPMLIENTDKDPIFPEDGVRRVYSQVKKVYDWYGAGDRLSLVIGKGGHADTEELRHPSFVFFEKYLKGKNDAVISEPDRRVPVEALKVFNPGEVVSVSRNASIDRTFVARSTSAADAKSVESWAKQKSQWMRLLHDRVGASWPSDKEAGDLRVKLVSEVVQGPLWMRKFEFLSEPGMSLNFWIFSRARDPKISRLWLYCESEESWPRTEALIDAIRVPSAEQGKPIIRDVHTEGKSVHLDLVNPNDESEPEHYAMFAGDGEATVIFAARGVGLTAWPTAKDTHIRRRFALLGQTVDGMRAFDIRRAMRAMSDVEKLNREDSFRLIGKKSSCESVVLAALGGKPVNQIWLAQPSHSLEQNQALLGVSRELEISQFLSLLYPTPLSIIDGPNHWQLLERFGKAMDPAVKWPYLPVQ